MASATGPEVAALIHLNLDLAVVGSATAVRPQSFVRIDALKTHRVAVVLVCSAQLDKGCSPLGRYGWLAPRSGRGCWCPRARWAAVVGAVAPIVVVGVRVVANL
jgi:hypothetical protein